MTGKPPKASDTQAWDVGVGRRIRARRLECKMSQTALGKPLGVTFQQIQKYEQGTNSISSGRLKQIGTLLQVPITFFYASDEDKRARDRMLAPTHLFDHLSRRDTLRLVTAFDRLTRRDLRNSLVQLVEKMARTEPLRSKR